MDLRRELACRGEDEDDGALARVEVGLGVDVDDGGEEERQGLAASRLRDGDDVAPGEGGGPGLRLNRGGGGETRARKLRGDVRGEGSLLERVRGFRGIAAGDGDVVSRAEGFHVSEWASRHRGVLEVEVLLEHGKIAPVVALRGRQGGGEG